MKTAKSCSKNSRLKISCLLTAVLVFALLRSESRALLTAVNMGVEFMNALVTSKSYLETEQDTLERVMESLPQANAYVLKKPFPVS